MEIPEQMTLRILADAQLEFIAVADSEAAPELRHLASGLHHLAHAMENIVKIDYARSRER